MPCILLDSLPPTIVGVGAYGFRKRLARISAHGDSFDIRSSEGSIVAKFENKSLPGKIQDFPRLAQLRAIFEQPMISETSTGSWVYSFIDHHLDSAEFQSIEGHARMRGRPTADLCFKGIPCPDQPSDGGVKQHHEAFRLTTTWDLTLPIRSGQFDGPTNRPSIRAFTNAMTNRFFRRFPGR
jgi:hypothetical protein